VAATVASNVGNPTVSRALPRDRAWLRCRVAGCVVSSIIDLLLPTTDAGVLAQLIVVVIAGVLGLALTRRHPDRRLLVVGATLVVLAFMAVRTLH
jgi:hypothetical protein